MKYYNEKGNVVEYCPIQDCMHGTSAFIEIIDNRFCWKEYYLETASSARMNLQTFQIIKSLESTYTYTLHSIFNKNEPFSSEQDVADAYLYSYIDETQNNICTMNKDILIDNLEGLENLIISLFVKEKLKADDLKKENVVIDKGQIRLIDLDNCRVENSLTIEEITKNNKKRLFLLLKSYLLSDLKTLEISNENVQRFLCLNQEQSFSFQLEKKLKGYKTIEEYFSFQ